MLMKYLFSLNLQLFSSQIIILAIISCINADINVNLLPPVNEVNVANVFHESGITFVTPSVRQLALPSSLQGVPIPITHSFGYVDISRDRPHELVRTHSSQQIFQSIESPVIAPQAPIQSKINDKTTLHRDEEEDHPTHVFHVNVPSFPTDNVQARYIENENNGVHEINSRTQHFEYKVPLDRDVPQHDNFEHNEHKPDHHQHDDMSSPNEFAPRNSIVQHSTYGVPSQDEINSLPVFQNDKFLSPSVRHTNTPTTTHSNNDPTTQTIESVFDPSFHSNLPTTHTRANTFDPSFHSRNTPTTHTRENIIDGDNQYTNRFSLSDGTKVSEQGRLISPAKGLDNVIAKTGEYEYISPEGMLVKVRWIADHMGYRLVK